MSVSKPPDLSFGLDARLMLHELLDMYRLFRAEPLNRKLARDCSSHTWHISEQIFHEFSTELPFVNLTEFRSHVQKEFEGIKYLHDICNASKHVKLSRPKSNIETTRLHHGDFDRNDFDRHDFDTSRLEIELCVGQRIDFEDLLDQAIDFWSTFVQRRRLFDIDT